MNLYDQKWQKFLSRIWLFKLIPFVDFVLASGSLATGNMNENSDFDVIVGVRQGRIFTARAFCILSYGIFGWRRKKIDHKESAKDKFCFNHFVTPAAYKLPEPYNNYWKKLYSSLVPVYGAPETIQKFFEANQDWAGQKEVNIEDPRYLYKKRGWIAQFREWILPSALVSWLERKSKTYQIRRIEAGTERAKGYKPRIIYNDNELEFHPDTTRTEVA